MRKLVLFLAPVATLPFAAGAAYAEEASVTTEAPASKEATPAQLPEPAFGTDAEEAMDGVSFSLAANSRYALDDLFVPTPKPTFEGDLAVTMGNCNADLWGSHAMNPDDHTGWEVDATIGCNFKLAAGTSINVTASRYFLAGPDITVANTTVTHQVSNADSIDVGVTYYAVDGQAEDATRVHIGYDHRTEHFDLRAQALWETGFDVPDIATAMTSVEYYATDHLSFNITGIIPVVKKDYDTRTAQVVVGVKFRF